MQIAIDGPAGAGKSTVARALAEKLGFVYIDTGAMYRTVALVCLRKGIDINDEEAVSEACQNADINIEYIDGLQHMFLSGEDVTAPIRAEEVGKAASYVSAYSRVRVKLVAIQQEIGEKYDVVMDGRDIGTKVLTAAPLKIFLTASSECRAKRRFDELLAKGVQADFNTVKEDIARRDYNDSHRKISPLVAAEDAIRVDTSQMDKGEVVDYILKLYKEKI